MSKFKEYATALENEIKTYYNSLAETDKRGKLILVEKHIDKFATNYFEGKTFGFDDRQVIRIEGQIVYDKFVKTLKID